MDVEMVLAAADCPCFLYYVLYSRPHKFPVRALLMSVVFSSVVMVAYVVAAAVVMVAYVVAAAVVVVVVVVVVQVEEAMAEIGQK